MQITFKTKQEQKTATFESLKKGSWFTLTDPTSVGTRALFRKISSHEYEAFMENAYGRTVDSLRDIEWVFPVNVEIKATPALSDFNPEYTTVPLHKIVSFCFLNPGDWFFHGGVLYRKLGIRDDQDPQSAEQCSYFVTTQHGFKTPFVNTKSACTVCDVELIVTLPNN